MAFREWLKEWAPEPWVPDRGPRPRNPKPKPMPYKPGPPVNPRQRPMPGSPGPGDRDRKPDPYYDPPPKRPPRPQGPPARPNFPLPPPGGGIPRWLPVVPAFLPLIDAIEPYFDPAKNPRPWVPDPGWWVFRCASGLMPGAPFYTPNGPNAGAWIEFFAGEICNLSSGQVPSGQRVALTPYTPTSLPGITRDTMILSDSGLQSGTALRMRHDVCWNHFGSAAAAPDPHGTYRPVTWPGLGPAPQPMPNPNPLRHAPAPQPVPELEPVPETLPQPEFAPPEWTWTDAPTAPRPTYPRPPRPGTKEVKVISKAKRIGIFLWKLMDNISETTEIVAGFYKALPKEVTDRWDCGSGINIGQYGSDVNACMAKALWHNWHKIDPGRAFIEVTKNLVEDMSIGAFHKLMAKLYPPGFSVQRTVVTHALTKLEMEKYIAGHLSDLFEWMGLEPENPNGN